MGSAIMIFCWIGSIGCGLSFIWSHMVAPKTSGQMPTSRNSGAGQSRNPNAVMKVIGSGAERSSIQPKKGAWRISMVTNSM